jgi:flagellar biosynthesis chaperone FliJ
LLFEKLKRYRSQGTDQISSELIQAVMHYAVRYTNLLNSIWNKEELSQQWKESVTVPIYKKG